MKERERERGRKGDRDVQWCCPLNSNNQQAYTMYPLHCHRDKICCDIIGQACIIPAYNESEFL